MNKRDLINVVYEKGKAKGITRQAAAAAVESVFETIQETLSAGDDVSLIGFGSFRCTRRSARQMKNPKTGAAVSVEAKTIVKFRVGNSLLSAVNGTK